ncbi:ribbon-helix-helix protein, CopG family [Natrinema hispanicum]|uniref:Ribbon-helix-helix protein, copG family n=1 Tax=Natrinema hispanicum TaxID=392421 RepID=A0A1G6XN64_9EURY|nr:ribbon-helix-helix protein, CopG family [Natrinema hispanicum]SDD79628.1 Ribbon-helix-helix protein, copG family [Natrinema hispanicum]
MKVTTLRLPEAMYEALNAEAEAEEMSLSEYIREILRERENTQENTQPNTTEYDDRLRELEQRLADLENQVSTPDAPRGVGDGHADPKGESGETDVVEWVRENQPVSRSEIVAAFRDEIDDRGIKPDSWWRRHARPALEEAGGEFTRNVGWEFGESGGVYDPTTEF